MKKSIIELLPVGKENAIPADTLCILAGIRDKRTLQKIIAKERSKGALILSHHSGGYYTSNDHAEIAEFAQTLENRAKNTFAAMKSARMHLKALQGQITLSEGQKELLNATHVAVKQEEGS